MIGFYNYTVILTYLGLSTGVLGIFMALNGNLFYSVVCLLFCGLFDMFDGKVARTKKRSKEEINYGIQIDSLSDLVCFGILPIIIGYAIGLNKYYHFIFLILYVLCALIRLAYFNVLEITRQDNDNSVLKCYTGLPVTSVALIFPLIYALKDVLGTYFKLVYLMGIILISFLFVSKIKIKKPSLKVMMIFILLGLIELIFGLI